MNENKNIKVEMNGKEYIEYMKQKEAILQVRNEKMKPLIYTGLAFVLVAALIFLISESMKPDPTPIVLSFPQVIRLIVAIGAALGWVFHGTGFFLFKIK